MNTNETIGEKIIAEIAKQGMVNVGHPNIDEPIMFTWSRNAASQLSALVAQENSKECEMNGMATREQLIDWCSQMRAVLDKIGCDILTKEGKLLHDPKIVDKVLVWDDPKFNGKDLQELISETPKFIEMTKDVQDATRIIRKKRYGIY